MMSDPITQNQRVCLESPDSDEIKLCRYRELFEATLSSGEQYKACLYGMLGAEVKTLNSTLTEQITHFFQENEIRLTKLLT